MKREQIRTCQNKTTQSVIPDKQDYLEQTEMEKHINPFKVIQV